MINDLLYLDNTLETLEKLINYKNILLDEIESLNNNVDLISNKIEFITNDLKNNKKYSSYVYHTAGGMLSYPGREELLNELNKKDNLNNLKNKNTTKLENKTKPKFIIKNVIIDELKYNIKLNVVNNLKDIPVALYYYEGDKVNSKGIYINVLDNNIIKVPFPEIVSSKETDRKHSIRCKFENKIECNNQRERMAKKHGGSVRVCNFAHSSDLMIKLGINARCPNSPQYGNPSTVKEDIKNINMADIKNLLLYGINDLALAAIWMNYNKIENIVINNLDNSMI